MAAVFIIDELALVVLTVEMCVLAWTVSLLVFELTLILTAVLI